MEGSSQQAHVCMWVFAKMSHADLLFVVCCHLENPQKERINKSLALKSVFGISMLFILFVVVFSSVVGYLYCVWCVYPPDRTSLYKLLFFYFTRCIFAEGIAGQLSTCVYCILGSIAGFAIFRNPSY